MKENKEVNLMISINEIEEIIKLLQKRGHKFYISSIKKEGIFFYLSDVEFIDGKEKLVQVKLYFDQLQHLLRAPRGLYNSRETCQTITNNTKFKIQLRKEGEFWIQ